MTNGKFNYFWDCIYMGRWGKIQNLGNLSQLFKPSVCLIWFRWPNWNRFQGSTNVANVWNSQLSSKSTYLTWITRLARWRFNRTGRLSVWEVNHDHENDDHDHSLIPDIFFTHKTGPEKCLRLAPTRRQVPVMQAQSSQKIWPGFGIFPILADLSHIYLFSASKIDVSCFIALSVILSQTLKSAHASLPRPSFHMLTLCLQSKSV
jgi:hypothetical protein